MNYSLLPPSCLSFANTASTLRSAVFLAATGSSGSSFGAVVTEAGSSVAPCDFDWNRLLLGGALNFQIEVDLRAQTERHRVERGQVRRIPVRAVADRLNGGFGRADQPHDLAVLELRMVAHQPEDRVGTILAARYRRVARALLVGRFRQADLRVGDVQPVFRIALGFGDLFAGQLPGENRIEPFDALRRVAVGNRFHLEHVQVAKLCDLLERKRGVLHQPHRGRLRHQGRDSHVQISFVLRPPLRTKPLKSSAMTGKRMEYRRMTPWVQPAWRLAKRAGFGPKGTGQAVPAAKRSFK